MWKSALARPTESSFSQAAAELMTQTTRSVIYITCGAWLLLQLSVGIMANDALSMRVWATLPLIGLAAGVALAALPRSLAVAQGVWQVGLALSFAAATLLFRQPEILLLLALLPFMAVVSQSWRVGLWAEAIALATAFVLSRYLMASDIPPAYVLAVGAGGLFAGALGWASSRSLYLVTEWSLQSFAEARKNMASARQSRAQLAQVLQDLDRAYYRLERTNAALVAAWRTAAEAERFKAELATNLSHELRTPLNLIIGFCEMIVTAPQKYGGVLIPREYRSDLNAIYQNARHLMSLVNDVLDLARIDVGRIALTRDSVDMATLATEAADMVREYVEAKGLQLHISVDPGLPTLWIDRLRIRQVLLNLLVNAARFTEAGEIELRVQDDGDGVYVAVRDTGRGIPEDRLPEVFEEFRQPTPTHPQGWPSTGLGLPISKRFIELHGGTMGVQSTFGAGSTFWFHLPDGGRPDVEEAKPRFLPSQPLREVAHHKRVIVAVQPDQRVLTAIQRYLSEYQIVGAMTCEEGVALANDLRALALLSPDGGVPQPLNAETLYIECRFPDIRRAAETVGAQDYLTKPVSGDELWGAIEGLGILAGRVLIADDEADMVRLLRRMLTPRIASSQVLEAYNGQEALDVMARTKPDLVLLDLEMPQVDGQGVLRAMRGNPTLADIPVILVSAHDPDELDARLRSGLCATKAGGLSLSELVRGIEANLSALAPGWH